ncbi:hypothetical protein DFR24_0033 [Panacagrimonas perspica]|uniref:Uncharacterized protein n=1 Tax=Panacagrimonas perspica TaxID=381431 RepID=A0A4R7P9M5_9GAMM|nr:hypothetical protein DFR24_0033 [Panacagrimonas perspica]
MFAGTMENQWGGGLTSADETWTIRTGASIATVRTVARCRRIYALGSL